MIIRQAIHWADTLIAPIHLDFDVKLSGASEDLSEFGTLRKFPLAEVNNFRGSSSIATTESSRGLFVHS